MIEDGWGLVTAEGVKDNEIEDRRGGGGQVGSERGARFGIASIEQDHAGRNYSRSACLSMR